MPCRLFEACLETPFYGTLFKIDDLILDFIQGNTPNRPCTNQASILIQCREM